MVRPSHKELNNKLNAALKAVQENRIVLVEPGIIITHAMELGYSIRHELKDVLLDLLRNTGPEHYAGHRPPQKSYETRIHNLDLWAFLVNCSKFDPHIYYKFSLCNDFFYLVSLHISITTKE